MKHDTDKLETFFHLVSLQMGRPRGLGYEMIRRGGVVGSKKAPPSLDGMVSMEVRLKLAGLAGAAGLVVNDGGDLDELIDLYNQWYKRNEPR